MLNRIQIIWKNRNKIFSGIYNAYLNFKQKQYIKKVSEERLSICRTNACHLYDKNGTSDAAFIPGAEACGGCGCNLKLKTSCLECSCFYEDIGREPLWKAIDNIDKKR